MPVRTMLQFFGSCADVLLRVEFYPTWSWDPQCTVMRVVSCIKFYTLKKMFLVENNIMQYKFIETYKSWLCLYCNMGTLAKCQLLEA